jgi:hypothetical protein
MVKIYFNVFFTIEELEIKLLALLANKKTKNFLYKYIFLNFSFLLLVIFLNINLFVFLHELIFLLPCNFKETNIFARIEQVSNILAELYFSDLMKNQNSELPYTNEELSEIFTILNSVLNNFATAEDFYFLLKEEEKFLKFFNNLFFFNTIFNLYFSENLIPEIFGQPPLLTRLAEKCGPCYDKLLTMTDMKTLNYMELLYERDRFSKFIKTQLFFIEISSLFVKKKILIFFFFNFLILIFMLFSLF